MACILLMASKRSSVIALTVIMLYYFLYSVQVLLEYSFQLVRFMDASSACPSGSNRFKFFKPGLNLVNKVEII